MKIKRDTAATIARQVLEATGAPAATAERVVSSLLAADDRGVATHGLGLLPLYTEMITSQVIDPAARPRRETIGDSLARVDGRRAFGQLTGELAVETGLELVRHHGIAAVGIRDGTHLGRLGEWAELACAEGSVFLAFTNTAGGALNVAGAGSSERVLSTNPLAIGVPTFSGLEHDVIIDFAASQVSGSRIREAANAGERIDPDWVVPRSGGETDDPRAFLDHSAALRPLGGRTAGHKGFGLMVAGEMLGALAGALMAGERRTDWFSNGALFCFLDVGRLVEPDEWAARARALADYLAERGNRMPGAGRGPAPKAGVGDSPTRDIELPDHTVASLLELAHTHGVDDHGIQAPAGGAGVTRGW